jgi:hypothetical protein
MGRLNDTDWIVLVRVGAVFGFGLPCRIKRFEMVQRRNLRNSACLSLFSAGLPLKNKLKFWAVCWISDQEAVL